MSELEKAIERLLVRPPLASFADVRRVLEASEWRQARQKGSHVTFKKPGERSITVPVHNGGVKSIYVGLILDRLGLER